MRNIEDLLRSRKIAEVILNIPQQELLKHLLPFKESSIHPKVIQDLYKPASQIHDRLINAKLICYEVDSIGSPLLKKREKNLIDDILKYFKKKIKS